MVTSLKSTIKVIYLGDIMGGSGLKIIESNLIELKKQKNIDLAIAQAENTTDGRGVSVSDYSRLRKAGVDFCTGGNWSLYRDEIIPLLNNPEKPIIRPANYPSDTPGLGYKYIDAANGKVLVISLLGNIVGRDADKMVENPLQIVDKILKKEKSTKKIATVVNFHGDFSSEKLVIGYFLDGRVSAVIGDHWHIPTADARILPKGTAHITDVGMCGSLDSSLGVKFDSVLPRWYSSKPTRNILETEGQMQFNAAIVDIDIKTNKAKSIEHIRKISDNFNFTF